MPNLFNLFDLSFFAIFFVDDKGLIYFKTPILLEGMKIS